VGAALSFSALTNWFAGQLPTPLAAAIVTGDGEVAEVDLKNPTAGADGSVKK